MFTVPHFYNSYCGTIPYVRSHINVTSKFEGATEFFFLTSKSFNKCTLKILKPAFGCYRRSCTEVFCKKGVLGNFTKFTGKHLCQRL